MAYTLEVNLKINVHLWMHSNGNPAFVIDEGEDSFEIAQQIFVESLGATSGR